MKREIDLARQLLLDIEARGADCSVSVLRSSANHEAEERVRYHLRLLVDAGLLKEIDRTAGDVPCLRLTDAGHELIELTRSDERWRQAKLACQERTGGLSMTVIRSILLKWATVPPPPRLRRRPRPAARYAGGYATHWTPYRTVHPYERPLDGFGEFYSAADPYEGDPHGNEYSPAYEAARAYELDALAAGVHDEFAREDQVRYVRVRPKHRNGWNGRNGGSHAEGRGADSRHASLPEELI
ncbi:MAG TPA: DUF2513 domain-containing protein [Lacipirellulaceae bacterium]|nr:DUF2513 domain-containing protein [Lacipirellulaceae bacterium]